MDKIQNTIIRFLQLKADNEELKSLKEWSSNKANLKELSDIQRIWIWTGLKKTAAPQVGFDKTWQKIASYNHSKKIVFYSFIKYAAIIVITLNLGWWSAFYFFSNEKNTPVEKFEVASNFEFNSTVILPDKTIVYLRPGTKISYNSRFLSGHRNVWLDGEAYFEVTKNVGLPFYVNMEYARVKVLGTKFNILAERGRGLYQTTLVEGKVEFITKNGKTYNLQPNQQLELDVKSNNIRIKEVNTELFIAWKDGKVIFRDESLGEITKKLEKIYNVKFIFLNPVLAEKYSFSGTFYRETSIGEVLTMLKLSIPMKVSREERFPEPDLIYLK